MKRLSYAVTFERFNVFWFYLATSCMGLFLFSLALSATSDVLFLSFFKLLIFICISVGLRVWYHAEECVLEKRRSENALEPLPQLPWRAKNPLFEKIFLFAAGATLIFALRGVPFADRFVAFTFVCIASYRSAVTWIFGILLLRIVLALTLIVQSFLSRGPVAENGIVAFMGLMFSLVSAALALHTMAQIRNLYALRQHDGFLPLAKARWDKGRKGVLRVMGGMVGLFLVLLLLHKPFMQAPTSSKAGSAVGKMMRAGGDGGGAGQGDGGGAGQGDGGGAGQGDGGGAGQGDGGGAGQGDGGGAGQGDGGGAGQGDGGGAGQGDGGGAGQGDGGGAGQGDGGGAGQGDGGNSLQKDSVADPSLGGGSQGSAHGTGSLTKSWERLQKQVKISWKELLDLLEKHALFLFVCILVSSLLYYATKKSPQKKALRRQEKNLNEELARLESVLGSRDLTAADVEALYLCFLSGMKAIGFPRKQSETPQEYLYRLVRLVPTTHAYGALLTSCFVLSRYGGRAMDKPEFMQVKLALSQIYRALRAAPDLQGLIELHASDPLFGSI